MGNRLNYYRRILTAYLGARKSHLTFWHDVPEVNEQCRRGEVGEYYMRFAAKADYPGQYDSTGVPLLDYHGVVGLQYNPIAVAQYGLGNYNLYHRMGAEDRKRKFLVAADWLVTHLEQNRNGLWVWQHQFDWEYRTTLKAPWYSALAQGQGLSLLVRGHRETGDPRYLETARRAFEPFLKSVAEGGVTYRDEQGGTWFEEYIVAPPTHILNGFIWAAWGVYDYALATGDESARRLFTQAAETILANLDRYDVGFWSLYELSNTWLKMLASAFYHRLHIVQLHIMSTLTGEARFRECARRWERYARDPFKRKRAALQKIVFKLVYY